MAKLIMMIGNIGAGKSTYIKKLVNKGFVVISKDDIRYSLGASKYIFNPQYEPIIHEATLKLFTGLLDQNANIVIDETNMNRETRKPYIFHTKLPFYPKYEIEALIMPKLSMEESVRRRLQSNHGNTPKEVWEEVWKRKNSLYEKPTIEEGFDIITEFKHES